MLEGGMWRARRYDFKTNVWVTHEVEAGDRCREMLRYLSVDLRRTFGMGRARGASAWRVYGLGGVGMVQADKTASPGWEEAATKSIEHLNLELEYEKWFGWAREPLNHDTARCTNIWDGAPSEV